MAEPQTSAAQTLTQVNHEFQAARVSRLDAAIGQALASKLPAAPKSGKPGSPPGGTPAPARTAAATSPAGDTSVVSTSDEPAPSPSSDVPPELASLATEAAPNDTADAGSSEPQEGAAEGQETGIDQEAIKAAAAQKDPGARCRALEKALGLETGTLGATNSEYAALRRRDDRIAEREREVETVHTANQQKLIDKFGPACDLITHAGKGDLIAYGRTIEVTTGLPIAKFIELWTANVRRVDPQVLEMQRKLAQYEAQNRPTNNASDGATPAAAPPADKTAAVAKADAYIAQEAKEHPALRLRDGAADVRKAWLASFDKSSNAFRLTPKQAADQVVSERRRAHEQEQWILSGKKPPPKPRTRTVNRTGAAESQPRKENLSREQLIERGALEIRRQKAIDAQRTGRR